MTEHEGINAPTSDEFEKLLVNNDGVARIEAYLNRFNPIRVMRMERMEIRHSAILAWLLDPRESHGLNDKFLKAFIGEALRGRSSKGRPTALDVARADLRDTAIRREWQNIDIFIHSESNGWGLCCREQIRQQATRRSTHQISGKGQSRSRKRGRGYGI